MPKVALIAVNAKYSHSALAVWLLKAALKQYGQREYDVSIIETTIARSADETAAMVDANTSIIGLSVYIWNAEFMLKLLANLKIKFPDAIIILGGPEAAHNAAFWLEQGADYVVRGEGERSFPRLLDELGKPQCDLTQIPGLSYVSGKGLQHNEIANIQRVGSMDEINPYDDEYFNKLGNRMPYVETARGCPFRCEFCLSGDDGLRFLLLDEAKRRLKIMAERGATTVKLVDRTFNANGRRAYELFAYVIRLDTEACFHFEVAADVFNEETLLLLQSAPPGRIQLEIGLQSFYAPALEAVNRSTDLNKVAQNVQKLLKNRNIHVHTDLIAGLPYETLTEFRNSFNRAYALCAHHLQLGFLKFLHGSPLRQKAEEWGMRFGDRPPYEISESKWLSQADLRVLKKTENALDRAYNKGRFHEAITYALAASGAEPFDFYAELGSFAPNSGMDLGAYCLLIFDFCTTLKGIDEARLRDAFIRDWLRRSGGSNLPGFLRMQDSRLPLLRKQGEGLLRRSLRRGDAALLWCGGGVIVDTARRNPATEAYHIIEIKAHTPV